MLHAGAQCTATQCTCAHLQANGGPANGTDQKAAEFSTLYGEAPDIPGEILFHANTQCTCAHFSPTDATAQNATESAALQAEDAYCIKLKPDLMTPETATEGRTYHDPKRSGLLMRRRTAPNRQDQVAVPTSLKASTLNRHHGLPLSAHMGRAKAYYYLPAATFAYNAPHCQATGQTPRELIYGGRMPALLQDLDIFNDTEPAGTPDYKSFQDAAAETLKRAYVAVRAQQEKIASSNRTAINDRRSANRKDGKPAKLTEYNVGDLVLFWEPAQAKVMQTTLQRLAHSTTRLRPERRELGEAREHQPCSDHDETTTGAPGIRRSKRTPALQRPRRDHDRSAGNEEKQENTSLASDHKKTTTRAPGPRTKRIRRLFGDDAGKPASTRPGPTRVRRS
jgi:hypothetical protein